MYPTTTELLAVQKSNVDALRAIGATVFQATEKLANLNLATTKALLEDGAEAAHQLLSAKDPQDLATIAGSIAQPTPDKLVAYARNAYTIANATGAELGRLVEAQINESNRKFGELLDTLSRNAPVGSEHMVGILKNSIQAANGAFDAVTRAARAATEAAESNIAAAVEVATESVKTKGRKAA